MGELEERVCENSNHESPFGRKVAVKIERRRF